MLGILTITGEAEASPSCSPLAVAGGVNAFFPQTCIWVETSRSVAGHTDWYVFLSVCRLFEQKSILWRSNTNKPNVSILPMRESSC